MRTGDRGARGGLALLLALCAASTAAAQPDDDARRARVAFRARGELGGLLVARHHIRYGDEGTSVDYRRDADQDTVFRFVRVTAELAIGERHGVVLVYQPLTISTESVLRRTLVIANRTFAAGTLTRFVYGFDFYRASYQLDLFDDPDRELAIGLGLQLRNARIVVRALDGPTAFTSTNLGVVPLLRLRYARRFVRGTFVELEMEGLATPVPGRTRGKQAVGTFLDLALRYGWTPRPAIAPFLGVRYLGGGYRGDSEGVAGLAPDEPTSNWLHAVVGTVGATLAP